MVILAKSRAREQLEPELTTIASWKTPGYTASSTPWRWATSQPREDGHSLLRFGGQFLPTVVHSGRPDHGGGNIPPSTSPDGVPSAQIDGRNAAKRLLDRVEAGGIEPPAGTAKEKKLAASGPWGMSKLPASPVDSRYLVPEGHGRDVSHRRCCRDLTVMAACSTATTSQSA